LGLALSITIIALTPAAGNAYDMTDAEIEHFGAMLGSLDGACEKKLEKMYGEEKWKIITSAVVPLIEKYEKHNLFLKNTKKSKAEASASNIASGMACMNGYNWMNGVFLGLNLK
jgi:hypothetical protein